MRMLLERGKWVRGKNKDVRMNRITFFETQENRKFETYLEFTEQILKEKDCHNVAPSTFHVEFLFSSLFYVEQFNRKGWNQLHIKTLKRGKQERKFLCFCYPNSFLFYTFNHHILCLLSVFFSLSLFVHFCSVLLYNSREKRTNRQQQWSEINCFNCVLLFTLFSFWFEIHLKRKSALNFKTIAVA